MSSGGYHLASSHTSAPEPDFSAFAFDLDDESPQSVNEPNPTTTHDSPQLPGRYDFEPQAYEGGTAGRTGGDTAFSAIRSHTSTFSPSRGQEQYGNRAARTEEEGDSTPIRSGQRSWRSMLFGGRGGGEGERNRHSTNERGSGGESNRLLFSQEESDETDSERRPEESTYPPRNIHLPLPPRPPTFAPPPLNAENNSTGVASSSTSTGNGAAGGRIYGGGASNDGVFSNLAAKPDGSANVDVVGEGPDKDEVLPVSQLFSRFEHSAK